MENPSTFTRTVRSEELYRVYIGNSLLTMSGKPNRFADTDRDDRPRSFPTFDLAMDAALAQVAHMPVGTQFMIERYYEVTR